MKEKKKHVLIIGAGCAGLAAGIALLKRGFAVTILEKEDHVGGLAGGVHIGQNTYEYGPHIFHTTDPEIMSDVKRIAASVLITFHKTIKIKFLGKYFNYPLSIPDVMTKLPPLTLLRAVFSFFFHFIAGYFKPDEHFDNSETVLQRYYGDVLYKIFFKDYIIKVWGIEPKDMDASFAIERIPRFDFLDFIDRLKKKIFGNPIKAISTDHYVEKIEGDNFTTKKGFSLIAEAFADEFKKLGGKLILNHALQSLTWDAQTKRVLSADDISADEFISTMPLSVLPQTLSPRLNDNDPLVNHAQALRFRGISFVGLLINRPKVLPASFMYFRDKSFNRITDLAQFEVEIHPANATILIAEITCQPGEPLWEDDQKAIAGVIAELIDESLIQRADVLEAHVFKASHGYPIYTVGYEKHLKSALHEINTRFTNLHTIGRQGKFAYINTHVAMKMGYDLARKLSGEGK